MRTVTLRDGTKVDVPNNVGRADIKRLAKQLVAQRRPAPKPAPRMPEPEIIPPSRMQAPDYRAAEMAMMRQELSALREQNRAVLNTLERIAAKDAPDHGEHMERMNGTLDRMAKAPAPVDPTPALRELKVAVASSADRIIEAFNAPVKVVRDANGKPVGIQRGK
jgi:hypothetical protein